MKKYLTLIVISIAFILNAQIVVTEFSNQLLLEPTYVKTESLEYANYFINEYQSLKLELETQLDTDLQYWDAINNDLQKIEDVLVLWLEKREEIESEGFIVNFNRENCFELETSLGLLKSDAIESMHRTHIDSSIFSLQNIEIEILKTKGKWVKKKKEKNCVSPNPEDCYVACWEEAGQIIFLVNERDKIEIDTFPLNFEYNHKNKRLERNIEIVPSIEIVIDTDGKVHEIITWEQICCEK